MNKKEVMEWIKSIAFSMLFGLLLILFARPTIVYGDSMNNTLKDLDILLTNQSYYRVNEFSYGDIIVFKSPENTNYIKRVIGVAGDQVTINKGKVFINGRLLDETYILEEDYVSMDLEVVVPKGKVFVLGDNRNNSKDSRHKDIGLLDKSVILGKAYLRLFPFSEIGSIY